jgi:hypothetical protein
MIATSQRTRWLRSSHPRSSVVRSSCGLPLSASRHLWCPQLQDEAPAVVAPQLEDVDPTVVSYELRTSPSCPIQWVVDSPKTHTADLTVDASPHVHHQGLPTRLWTTMTLPNTASTASSTMSRVRGTPKQPPANPVLPWWSRRLASQSLSCVPASKRGEVFDHAAYGQHQGSISAIRFGAEDL